MTQQYRLVTRSDFDGLVCAVLLRKLDLIDDIKFVHPKDMQDGDVDITDRDITTNLPYVAAAHMVFDHHHSEMIRNEGNPENHVIDPDAPSAARVVWLYYGGHEVFPEAWDEMMEAVDKGDSAQYGLQEVLAPRSWELLNFLMDARTGLGRFREFRISNYQLMMDLIEYCKDSTIEEILALPDVKERVDFYAVQHELFKDQIIRCAKQHDNLVVLDLRDEEIIHAGNRFIIYALFPACNISIHVMWGLNREKTVFATGKSIFHRDSNTNIGELMLKYDGGGHEAAGTCQVENDQAAETLEVLIQQINQDG
jgi:nanoRNase/pAp phosphatase (c-di-AMP/oligoRNAs hydrolase)